MPWPALRAGCREPDDPGSVVRRPLLPAPVVPACGTGVEDPPQADKASFRLQTKHSRETRMRGHVARREITRSNGSVSVKWYVVVDIGRHANGRRRQKWHGAYPTRREAEDARARIVADLYDGSHIEPSSMTVDEYLLRKWLPQVRTRVKDTTWVTYESIVAKHLMPSLGRLRVQDLTARHLTGLYMRLHQPGGQPSQGRALSAKTVQNIHRVIHRAMADAVAVGLLPRNPAADAVPPRPRTTARDLRVWSAELLQRFLDSARSDPLYPAFRLAALTGMRRGEVLGLRWCDLDLSAAQVAVRQTLVLVRNLPTATTPKTHQARTLALDALTCRVLGGHLDRAQHSGDATDLLFQHDGNGVHPSWFSVRFQRLAGSAGLPRIRLYDLRHTHATLGLSLGVPAMVMSERLGHASPGFTLRQYAHVAPCMDAEAAAVIAKAIEDGPGW